jgi:hypothetical protein
MKTPLWILRRMRRCRAGSEAIKLLAVLLISPLALAGLILWVLLLWNYETANGTNYWQAFKTVCYPP